MITVQIPAAIRGCSPVVCASEPSVGSDVVGSRGVVKSTEDGEVNVNGWWTPRVCWALNISDPTGAAHLAWWLLAPEQARGFARMAQAIDATGWTFDGRLQILNMAARGEAVGETALGHMRDYAHHIAGVTNG